MTVMKKNLHYFMLFLSVLLIALDQWTKYLAATLLPRGQSHSVIGNFLHLSYLENTGAAFGMFAGNSLILIGLTGVMIAVLILFVLLKKPTAWLLCVSLTLIIAGGAGNLIDRALRGYVVDFFYLKFINFAVFNLADCFVVVGTGLLFYYVLQNERKERREQDMPDASGTMGNDDTVNDDLQGTPLPEKSVPSLGEDAP